MKRSWVLAIIGANLIALIILVFTFPDLMISPGPVIPAHGEIARDCFACHSPLRGVAPERCQSCHVLADIGIRSTQGIVLIKPQHNKTLNQQPQIAFHQQLTEQNCMACHSDHVGPKLTRQSQQEFSHALLNPQVRTQCDSCHTRPDNTLHTTLYTAQNPPACSQCHNTNAWKAAAFNHDLLPAGTQLTCNNCHAKPQNDFHAHIQGDCQQCHSVKQWKPSTFNHDALFVLDRDHNAACATCHVNNNFARYSCFGCHEHTPANIRAEHEEEGIRNFDDCVKCHRSAEDEGGEHRNGKRSDD